MADPTAEPLIAPSPSGPGAWVIAPADLKRKDGGVLQVVGGVLIVLAILSFVQGITAAPSAGVEGWGTIGYVSVPLIILTGGISLLYVGVRRGNANEAWRILITETADPRNYLGADQWGRQWYARAQLDGSQVWAAAIGDDITHGGVNTVPWTSIGPQGPLA